MQTKAYAATSATAPLAPWTFERRAVGPRDVQMEILFCGICHSDIHTARNEWGGTKYPIVPGHEIVGRVTAVGKDVKRFEVGDLGGVGCLVDSCGDCTYCREDHEQMCERGSAGTYNSTEMDRATPTYGGYAQHIVVTERFVLSMPANLEPSAAAPLLCAGITTYSPLKQWSCRSGSRVGVVGLGGLGHMAVKIASAMGAEVTMLSTSPAKQADAKRLGAADFALTTDKEALKNRTGRFDIIIDTVSATHDYNALLRLVRPYGVLVCVGAPPGVQEISPFALIPGNKRLAGSMIGGIRETQEMLDFCGEKKLASDVEVIAAKQINEAYERAIKGDVRYRFSIDARTFA